MKSPHPPRGIRRGHPFLPKFTVLLAVAGTLSLAPVGVATSGATTHSGASLVVTTLKTTKFGTILVSGTTLYTLKPSGTGCNTACQKYWPEVLLPKGVKKATAGPGVSASKLGTLSRPGGKLQVTYGGQPLYRFVLDTGAGQVKGNVVDSWGKWSDVVTVKPASAPTTTTSSPSSGGVGF